ncbi:MAG: hypothetical protein AAF514_11150 [Verrucomicrobiota bacterium]
MFKTLGLLFTAGMMVVAFIYLPKTVLKKKGIEAEETAIAENAEDVLLIQPGEATVYQSETSSADRRTNDFAEVNSTPPSVVRAIPALEPARPSNPDPEPALKAIPVVSAEKSPIEKTAMDEPEEE